MANMSTHHLPGSSHRFFGRRPDHDLLLQLGLAPPGDSPLSGQALYEWAVKGLADWATLRDQRLAQVDTLPQDYYDRDGFPARVCLAMLGTVLTCNTDRAGLRVWLDEVLSAPVTTAGPADLRCWCQLQLRAMEVSSKVYPVELCWLGSWLFRDVYLLEDTPRLLRGEDLASKGGRETRRLEDLSWFSPDDPPYDSMVQDIDGDLLGLPVPKRPTAEEWAGQVRRGWRYLRDLGGRLSVGWPAEPKDLSEEHLCRNALDRVIRWCRYHERLAARATASGGAKKQKRWTRQEVDTAIKQLRAEKASTYYDLVENVRLGLRGAKKKAKELFGRNALARRFGLRSPALVTYSPVWQEIAEELDLPHKGEEMKRLGGRGRTGYEMAAEEKAEEVGDTTFRRVTRNETVSLIRRSLPADHAEATISMLEAGQITDDSARQIVQLDIQRRKDDTHKVYQSP
jgi:hypothetical protein